MKSKTGLIAAAAIMGMAASVNPFKRLPTVNYTATKMAPPKRKRSVAGSKLERLAAKGHLTGNKNGVYCQGLMRQFARIRQGMTVAQRKAHPLV
jgi:hypothetical protein